MLIKFQDFLSTAVIPPITDTRGQLHHHDGPGLSCSSLQSRHKRSGMASVSCISVLKSPHLIPHCSHAFWTSQAPLDEGLGVLACRCRSGILTLTSSPTLVLYHTLTTGSQGMRQMPQPASWLERKSSTHTMPAQPVALARPNSLTAR